MHKECLGSEEREIFQWTGEVENVVIEKRRLYQLWIRAKTGTQEYVKNRSISLLLVVGKIYAKFMIHSVVENCKRNRREAVWFNRR